MHTIFAATIILSVVYFFSIAFTILNIRDQAQFKVTGYSYVYMVLLITCLFYNQSAEYKFATVAGSSMCPTFCGNEFVAYREIKGKNLADMKLGKGNVILYDLDDYIRTKRILAAPGDVVCVSNRADFKLLETGEKCDSKLEIGNGEYFVVGDNPGLSYDSRIPEHGVVSERNIVGVDPFVLSELSIIMNFF